MLTTWFVASFSAGIVGTWSVRDYNYFDNREIRMVMFFGVLSEAESIRFDENGTFFCNDTVSGTYLFKDDELVLARDREQVKDFVEKYDWLASHEGSYACDTFRLTFTTQGNKVLCEMDKNNESVHTKDYNFGIIFELTKQGTNGMNEDLNEGKSVVGEWLDYNEGRLVKSYVFREKGAAECVIFFFDEAQMSKKFKYEVNGNRISTKGKATGLLDGELVFGRNCIYVVTEKDGTKIALKYVKRVVSSNYLITNNSVGLFKVNGRIGDLPKSYGWTSTPSEFFYDNCQLSTVKYSGGIEVFYKFSCSLEDAKPMHKNKKIYSDNYSDNCSGYYCKDSIDRVFVYSPDFKVAEGVGVGSTFSEMKKAFPDLYSSYFGGVEGEYEIFLYVKKYPDLRFHIDPDGLLVDLDNEEGSYELQYEDGSHFRPDAKVECIKVYSDNSDNSSEGY